MPIPFDEFRYWVEKVGSADSADHGPFLYALVRWLKPQTVVEVGTFRGYTACWLARALEENGGEAKAQDENAPTGRLVCIDDFSLTNSSLAQVTYALGLCRIPPIVQVLEGRSDEVPWPACDFAFIDGCHSYAACCDDVARAMDAGASCIAVHDTVAWEGVRRWLDEFRQETRFEWDVLNAVHGNGLAVCLKRQPLPPPRYTERDYPEGVTG